MRFLIITIAGLTLSGCATTWDSDRFPSDEAKQAQLKVDTGYCRSVSYGAVPMPPVRDYVPQQQSYNIRGTATGYNSQSGYNNYSYTATATPMPNAGASLASGFAQGVAIGASLRASRDREEVFNACMTQLGWSEKPTSSEPGEKANSAATQPTAVTGAPTKEFISCFNYKIPGQPESGINFSSLVGEYIVDRKARTITDPFGAPLTPHAWETTEIVLTEKTDQTYDTKPPITKTLIEVIDLERQVFLFSYLWVTSNDLGLNPEQLEAVAGGHPLYKVRRGIEPSPGFIQAGCVFRSDGFL